MRRAVAVAATVGCLVSAPGSGAAGPSAVAARIDPAHTGSVDDPAVVPPLRPRWVRELDAPDTYQPRISRPLIADGRVFVVVAPSSTGVPVLHALSAATGESLWSRTLTGPLVPQPAYDAGRVIVATYDDVRAFDAATGEPLWTRTDVDGQGTSAVAAGGVVYTNSSWNAVALRGSDGSTVWTRELFSVDYVTLGEQHVYYHGSRRTYALRRSDGALAWEYFPGYGSFLGGSLAPLVLHGGRLWFTDGVDSTLMNAAAGTPAGTRDSSRMPAFWDGLAFVSWGHNPVDPQVTVLQARDEATDALRWEFAAERGILTEPTAVTGTVYVLGYYGALYGLAAADGRLRWCTSLPYSAERRGEVVAGEGLLLVVAGPALVAFEPGGPACCDYNRVSRPGWYDPLPGAAAEAAAPPLEPGPAATAPARAATAVLGIRLVRSARGVVTARVRGVRLGGRQVVVYTGRRPRRAASGRLRRVASGRYVARLTVRRRGRVRACVRLGTGRCGRRMLASSSPELWPR
jgi:outer membrane protein assembly factor BamB